MSKSIRISDELLERAKEEAERFHRSPPQQIEHWAEIGRVMEPAMSYGVSSKVKQWGSRDDIQDLVNSLSSEEAKVRTKYIIQQNSDGIVEGNS